MREITSIWQTDELRRYKPTPVEEAKAGKHLAEDCWILHAFVKLYIRTCYPFYYLRLEHCGAVPLESPTSLFTPRQQCSKEGLPSN